MKNLQELMKSLSKSDLKIYCAEISKWDDSKKKQLEELANYLLKAGAKNPIPWAYSEIEEEIPQFGRFLVLKNLFAIIEDINSVIVEASNFDDDIQNKLESVLKVLGDKSLRELLLSYGKAVISGVVSILDEGNCCEKKCKVSWQLSETDGEGNITGRIINGLHEDFYDFNE